MWLHIHTFRARELMEVPRRSTLGEIECPQADAFTHKMKEERAIFSPFFLLFVPFLACFCSLLYIYTKRGGNGILYCTYLYGGKPIVIRDMLVCTKKYSLNILSWATYLFDDVDIILKMAKA